MEKKLIFILRSFFLAEDALNQFYRETRPEKGQRSGSRRNEVTRFGKAHIHSKYLEGWSAHTLGRIVSQHVAMYIRCHSMPHHAMPCLDMPYHAACYALCVLGRSIYRQDIDPPRTHAILGTATEINGVHMQQRFGCVVSTA